VGPSLAGLEAVKRLLGRGAGCAARYVEDDPADLVTEILRYNRRLHPSARALRAENVMLLVGSSDGLMLTADTFVAGGTLVGEWPAYRIIRERVWQQGGTVVDVPLRSADRQPDYAALLQALGDHPGTGLVHFNAQNNPMGTVIQRGEFDRFARAVFANHAHTVILVDESDYEWMEPGQAATQPDYLAYVARGQNLVHLQTFSHIFGLTGLRVGYLLAPRRLVARMRRKRITRPVNVFGHAAALAALRDAHAQIKRCHPVVAQGRDYLYSELDKMGLRYSRSQGQYLMIDTGVDGTAVWSVLIGLGVLTRYGREWGMESWIRVCPGLPDENQRFISSLKTALAQPDLRNPPCLAVPITTCPPVKLPSRHATLAATLERSLARDTFVARRLGPLERPYRVTRASAFR
jgi:histidinol-phosphate aminotransferase